VIILLTDSLKSMLSTDATKNWELKLDNLMQKQRLGKDKNVTSDLIKLLISSKILHPVLFFMVPPILFGYLLGAVVMRCTAH
jgi:hypothetical protein